MQSVSLDIFEQNHIQSRSKADFPVKSAQNTPITVYSFSVTKAGFWTVSIIFLKYIRQFQVAFNRLMHL